MWPVGRPYALTVELDADVLVAALSRRERATTHRIETCACSCPASSVHNKATTLCPGMYGASALGEAELECAREQTQRSKKRPTWRTSSQG